MIPLAPGFFKYAAPSGLSDANKPMLVSLFVGGTTAILPYNKNDPANPRKAQYDAAPADMLYHADSAFGTYLSHSVPGPYVTQNYFDRKAKYRFFAGNTSWSGDYAEIDIEFLTEDNTVRAAIRTRRVGTYTTQLYYGPNLSSLIAAGRSSDGGYYAEGDLSFTDTQMLFTNTRADFYNDNFILGGLNMTDVVKFRYTNAYVYAGSIAANSQAVVSMFLESVAASVPPVVPLTTSLLRFDGTHGSTTITDETPGKTWTAYGGASLSNAQSKFGGTSLFLNGTSAYIHPANHLDFRSYANEMCFEGWVWMDSTTANFARLAETSAFNSATAGWLLFKNSSGVLTWQLAKSGGGGSSISTNAVFPTNQWVHLALVRRAGIAYIYVNGVQQTATLSLPVTENWRQQFIRIGCDTTGANFFKGYIDDMRYTVGSPVYTANFTPPINPLPIL